MIRLAASLALLAAPSFALADPLPKTGTVTHAAYTVCRSLGGIDLGEVGSDSSADCVGVVKTKDGVKPLDNLAVHCLEASTARKVGYKFTG